MIPLLVGTPVLAQIAKGEGDSSPDREELRLLRLFLQSPKDGYPQVRNYLRQKLDSAFEIALAAAEDSEHRRAIEEAQKQWLEYYEAQLALGAYNKSTIGAGIPAAQMEDFELLRSRTATLTKPIRLKPSLGTE